MSLGADSVEALFLDANVLISAAWKEGAEVALLWRFERVRLITSGYVLGEVQRNLHQASQIERLRTLMGSVQIHYFEDLPDILESLSLPTKDRPVLAGAVAARADHLVTGDKKHFGPFYGTRIHGVRITPPSELLAVLRQKLP